MEYYFTIADIKIRKIFSKNPQNYFEKIHQFHCRWTDMGRVGIAAAMSVIIARLLMEWRWKMSEKFSPFLYSEYTMQLGKTCQLVE